MVVALTLPTKINDSVNGSMPMGLGFSVDSQVTLKNQERRKSAKMT